jgi:flagellar protein FlgJ
MTNAIASSLPLIDTPQNKPSKVEDAAKQFEALLIGQMLRSVREANTDEDADQSSAAMLDMADQQFAQVLASQGGLGLARIVGRSLTSDKTQGTTPAKKE